MLKEAIILAGGFGTRLKQVISEVPKPMAPVNGRPFLEYLLDYLIAYDFRKVILSVGHKSEIIQNHFKKKYKNLEIVYAFEDVPLGTGGAVVNALKFACSENILVLNGDTFFDVNLSEMNRFHTRVNSNFTIAVRNTNDLQRYGTLKINDESRIKSFDEKNTKTGEGLINGGVYLIKKSVFDKFMLSDCFSVEKDFFEKYFNKLNLYAFISDGYFIDIGIPDDYYKAQDVFKEFKY